MTSTTDSAEPRKRLQPSQERSRKRVQAILDAAAELISTRGLAPVSMTDIAEQAEMALTAVYRYFPNKQALVRELAIRTFDVDLEMARMFEAARTDGDYIERIKPDLIAYCNAHLQNGVRTQIRAAIHADAELSALNLADSRQHAAMIAEGLDRAGLETRRSIIEDRALLVVSLVDGVIRLANQLEPEAAAAVIEDFAETAKWMLLRPTTGGKK